MADLNRGSIDGDLMLRKPELFLQHLQVLLNEKLNHLKQLDVHLDQLRTVEIERVELKKNMLVEEIKVLQSEIEHKSVIEIKPSKEGGDK